MKTFTGLRTGLLHRIRYGYWIAVLIAGFFAAAAAGWSEEKAPEPETSAAEAQRKKHEAGYTGSMLETDKSIYQELESGKKSDKKPLISWGKSDLANVHYGPHERNVLDFWKAKTSAPAPVVLHFHGGGFIKGDKQLFNRLLLRNCLKNGISFATANYRLVAGKDSAPFPAPMLDGARAVQFLRSKAQELNIDPKRIALAGWSAGANISLWIAFHNDLADPNSSDPVARLSTRVTCVLASNAQTSNDPRFILQHIGGKKDVHPSLLSCYGIKSFAEFDKPELQQLITEASAINHLTKDDPPVFLWYLGSLTKTPLPENTSPLVTVHHPQFGVILKEKMDALGVACQLYYKGREPKSGAVIAFLRKQFGMEQENKKEERK